MSKCLKLFLTLGVICFSFVGIAKAEISFAVVDVQKILSESNAAKSIKKQIQVQREKLQAEFSGYEKTLRDNEKQLIKDRQNMTAEEFNQKREQFQKELQTTGGVVQAKKRKLETALVKATSKLRSEIIKIVAEMAEAENIDVVMSRQNIVLVSKTLDKSEEIMAKVNSKISSIPLEIEK